MAASCFFRYCMKEAAGFLPPPKLKVKLSPAAAVCAASAEARVYRHSDLTTTSADAQQRLTVVKVELVSSAELESAPSDGRAFGDMNRG